MPMRQRKWLRSSSSWMSFSADGCWCRSWAEKITYGRDGRSSKGKGG